MRADRSGAELTDILVQPPQVLAGGAEAQGRGRHARRGDPRRPGLQRPVPPADARPGRRQDAPVPLPHRRGARGPADRRDRVAGPHAAPAVGARRAGTARQALPAGTRPAARHGAPLRGAGHPHAHRPARHQPLARRLLARQRGPPRHLVRGLRRRGPAAADLQPHAEPVPVLVAGQQADRVHVLPAGPAGHLRARSGDRGGADGQRGPAARTSGLPGTRAARNWWWPCRRPGSRTSTAWAWTGT